MLLPLKYLSSFRKILEMSLTNCQINLILTSSAKCVLSNYAKTTTFPTTNTKLCVPAVTLSALDNTKLFEQLKSGFKGTVQWNKYQPKVSPEIPNQYLDFLTDPSFQRVNRIFPLSFENDGDRVVHTKYYLAKVEIKDCNVMIDGKNTYDQPVRNNIRTYDNIRKNATGQGDDYTTVYLLDYSIRLSLISINSTK